MPTTFKVLIFIIFTLPVFLIAQPVTSPKQQYPGIINRIGDSPLQPFTSYEGNGSAIIKTYYYNAVSSFSDTMSINKIPADATIKEAYLIFSDWRYDSTAAAAVLIGSTLSDGQIFIDIDNTYHLTTTVYNITKYITGNGAYDISASGMVYCYFMSLVVIYENPSSEALSLFLNVGSESLQHDSSSTSFNFSNAHSDAQIVLLTQAADPNGSKDEQVHFNGETIRGPGDIFFGNLGPYADQIVIDSVNIIEGENKLMVITGSDWFGFHLAMVAHGDLTSSIEYRKQSIIPKEITLDQNYPNPFNPSTNISFNIPTFSKNILDIDLSVYNILGEKVTTLYNGKVNAGRYTVNWKGLDDFGNQVPTGIYLYQLHSKNFSQTKRMLLIK